MKYKVGDKVRVKKIYYPIQVMENIPSFQKWRDLGEKMPL